MYIASSKINVSSVLNEYKFVKTGWITHSGACNPSNTIVYKVTMRPVSKDNCAASAIFCAARPSSKDGLGFVPLVNALIKLTN